jgi:calcineurin-like phosphoesterase family protein
MSNVFYTSDAHLGHNLVAGKRGFATSAAHDTHFCDQWTSVVKPDDLVWVLGDLATSSPTHALSLLSQLPGRKRLIKGNHDRNHSMHRNAPRWDDKYREVFEYTADFGRVRAGGVNVLLSHFPYYADHTDPPRHMQYRLPEMGELLMHGHNHSKRRYTSAYELHVGVDAWDMTPVHHDIVAVWARNQTDSIDLLYPEMSMHHLELTA